MWHPELHYKNEAALNAGVRIRRWLLTTLRHRGVGYGECFNTRKVAPTRLNAREKVAFKKIKLEKKVAPKLQRKRRFEAQWATPTGRRKRQTGREDFLECSV